MFVGVVYPIPYCISVLTAMACLVGVHIVSVISKRSRCVWVSRAEQSDGHQWTCFALCLSCCAVHLGKRIWAPASRMDCQHTDLTGGACTGGPYLYFFWAAGEVMQETGLFSEYEIIRKPVRSVFWKISSSFGHSGWLCWLTAPWFDPELKVTVFVEF